MNVLLVNGSPHADGCTYTALNEIGIELEKGGVEFEFFQIGKKHAQGCIACYHCRKSGSGYCVFDDDGVNELIRKMNTADAIVIGSPVYYAGIAGQLKALLDRAFFASVGLENKFAASVVSCRRGGAIAAFDELNHYFTVSNMHLVSSQYWNQVHGSNPDEVRKDLEGLQTMRSLAKNMVWLLKCVELADKNGLERPQYEDRIRTNFI